MTSICIKNSLNRRIFAISLLLFFSASISKAAYPSASLLYKIQFEAHNSAPADVVVEADGSTGVYDAFSGSYLTYDGKGKSVGSVQKGFLKGGNCLVKDGDYFFFCNNTNASLDMLSNRLEKRASFRLSSDIKGKFDPTDALVVEGYVYSVDNDNHRIIKINLATETIERSVGGYGQSELSFYYPYSLAVDYNGILYVSEVMNTRVQKITKELKFYGVFGKWGVKGGEFYRPTGVAVYKGKTLLVADGYLGMIQLFDMDGIFIGLLADKAGKKLELGSITHIRVNASILAAVDAFNKRVYVYKLREP